MRTWAFIGSLAFAATAPAQTFPSQEPKSSVPVSPATTHDASQNARVTAPNRNQFRSPVMPIQIEGAGLAIPTGVERDSPYSPPIPVPAPAKPPATEK